MISLRKFLDQTETPRLASAPAESEQPEPVPGSADMLGEYRALLIAIADCGERAVPSLGPELKQRISGHGRKLGNTADPTLVRPITQAVQSDLSDWAVRAENLHTEHQRELQQIIAIVASTAENVGRRDERYASEIGTMARRLRTVADSTDIAAIRRSIIHNASAFQTVIAKMAEESRETVSRLSAQADQYRIRLEETERMSLQDPLTGLKNRRALERAFELRVSERQPFSLIVMDLDGFKAINDQYGHLAGDDLLKQFGDELQMQFPVSDVVTRFGGDEFVCLVAGDIAVAEERAARIRKWALGIYKIDVPGNAKLEVRIDASLGVVQWDGDETTADALARADARMYTAKAAAKEHRSAGAGLPLQPRAA
jgi:diguanylate cyclase (GGDEF)-like protein